MAPTLHDHSGMFAGSLLYDSSEGEDPHDHGQSPFEMPSDRSDAAMNASFAETDVAEAHPGVRLDWTGDAMVRAFVMQEVLKRPQERAH